MLSESFSRFVSFSWDERGQLQQVTCFIAVFWQKLLITVMIVYVNV